MSGNKDKAAGLNGSSLDGEVVAEAEVREIPGETLSATVRPAGSSRLALTLAILSLVVLVGALWFGYQYKISMRDSLLQMEQAVIQARSRQTELQQQLDDTRQSFEAQRARVDSQSQLFEQQSSSLQQDRAKLQQERDQLQTHRVAMQDALAEVKGRLGRNSSQWMAAEAQYLMQVADSRLQLAADVGTAIEALRAADRRLRDTGDPGFIGVRELLAAELTWLEAVEQPDLAGLSAQLDRLEQQAATLRLAGVEPPQSATGPESAPRDGGERNFKSLLQDSWEGFKSVMVIRRRGEPVTAMLPPEQRYFVTQNLRLRLQGARLALLGGDQAVYLASLRAVEQWLREFFDLQQAPAQAALNTLAALQQVELHPELPDISASLIALRERLRAAENAP